MKKLELIGYEELSEAVNISLEIRRLELYSLKELMELYQLKKKKVLILDKKISKLYDTNKLNFSHDLYMNIYYCENRSQPQKDKIIDTIIYFLQTEYLIKKYLEKLDI